MNCLYLGLYNSVLGFLAILLAHNRCFYEEHGIREIINGINLVLKRTRFKRHFHSSMIEIQMDY